MCRGCHAFHVFRQQEKSIFELFASNARTWKQRPSPAARTESALDYNTPISSSRTLRIPREKTKPMPITGYDSEAIEDFYDRRPFQVGWRLNSIGFPLLGWYFSLLMDKAMGISEHLEVQTKRGVELREHLIRSKSVALIKSGQALSLRPDLIKNKIWANELGKLVDAVGSFSDLEAMKILKSELADVYPKLESTAQKNGVEKNSKTKAQKYGKGKNINRASINQLETFVSTDVVLSLFDFYNHNQAVASASIGQVYKARIRPGPRLEAAVGPIEAARWGGKVVAIKIQRPDAEGSASLDMYLLRRTATWLSKVRGGDLPQIADAFGMQLFGELDYVREANNCDRFRELYGGWSDIVVPHACSALTRRKVLVMEWVDGEKGPWNGKEGLEMVKIGLRCSVDQLMTTGLFHADPHRGNMLKTPDGKLAFIDFGMMADIDEEQRYGLFGLLIGLQNKDLPLVTENLLKLGFLKETTQLDLLVPRLREALMNATGGSGKASDVNFARLQAELDSISRENILRFSTPPFFTIIIRSLTILEGVALDVDPSFKLVRGSYPYVLNQLLSPEDGCVPGSLQKLLVRLLTVDGLGREIEWERLREFLRLAQKASKAYNPSVAETDDKSAISRQTIQMFGSFLTSRTGIFLKKPLVHELAEAIDSSASSIEGHLFRVAPQIPRFPGMSGPVDSRRMAEIQAVLETFQEALVVGRGVGVGWAENILDLFQSAFVFVNDERLQEEAGPLLMELQSVISLVAVEVLEIRGSRAIRALLPSRQL